MKTLEENILKFDRNATFSPEPEPTSSSALESRASRLGRRLDALEEMVAVMNGDMSMPRAIRQTRRDLQALREELSAYAESLSAVCKNQEHILGYLRHLTSSPYDARDAD